LDGPVVRELLWALIGQDKAVANARVAATALARRRVERDEVELYLEARRPDPTGTTVPPEGWGAAPARAAD
jgi:hypothetical protein